MCESRSVTLRATLFDMDGLLIDSERLWHRAELEIFGELGVPLDAQKSRSTKGVYVDDVVALWFSLYPWTGPTPEEVVARLVGRVGELVSEVGELLPGAERAIDLASERGPVALASSTPMSLIEHNLDCFGLRDRFRTLNSAQFESHGKPHPAVFLRAAESLGVAPTDCLVFEDSAAGVIAAKAGRMHVVAVPTEEDRHLAPFAMADLLLSSLEELDPAWMDVQFGRNAL